MIKLAGEYYYIVEGRNQKVIVPQPLRHEEQFIPCKIEAYDHDENFIIASQTLQIPCFYGIPTGMPKQHYGEKYFWIIEVPAKIVHGPLTEDLFNNTRETLNVTPTLTLTIANE